MKRIKDAYLKNLVWETSKIGHDKWRNGVFDYFRDDLFSLVVLDWLNSAECVEMFDANTRQSFKDWFQKFNRESVKTLFEEFITLLDGSHEFTLLSYYLYSSPFTSIWGWGYFSDDSDNFQVKSSSGDVFETRTSAATALSGVLRELEKSIPDAGRGGNAIPVPQLSSPVLWQVTAFFNMKHDYTKSVNTAMESLASNINATIEHIKAIGNDYHAAVTNFVQANISNFPSLQQAADYLDIPTLARFTSMALGLGLGDNNMKEKSVQDISNWYAGVSKLGMLSPLLSTFTKQIHSIISHVDFFS